jgi:hypothetical protein
MYDGHSSGLHRAEAAYDDRGLRWLLAANEAEAQRIRMFRGAHDEEQVLLMRSPISTSQAYAIFGTLLGAIPSAAIFYRLFGYGFAAASPSFLLLVLCLAMNAACCAVGGYAANKIGQHIEKTDFDFGWRLLTRVLGMGTLWGVATGGAGGVLFFLIGAPLGMIFAVPVACAAFFLFVPLHHVFSCAGMIDRRHCWPLASGITMVLAAFIVSPYVFPY